ncbi:hypothetical protein F3J20_22610 [Paraburkholderia sp. Cy-641]|uniref:hypothetical protein n=1 Tax=Paraburkholderia sp. Cy-641 TaxID=2608337 RepID=UPI0014222C74|nr:hypothetical protein [Paraburkholderia sp. Cy-641]NIF80150.1 hypothetical protein [Paraburkholderia sp. Cy-641]
MSKSKEFELNEIVQLAMSSEAGTVIGKAHYVTGENSYLVRYQAADGRQVEQWWGESALIAG